MKVLNKYYPSDFDPKKLPRIGRPKNRQQNVRMMLPMSIRCTRTTWWSLAPNVISRLGDEEEDKERKKKEAEELGESMKALENRSLDSKRQMDILATIGELKSIKCKHAHVSLDSMLESLLQDKEKKKKLEEEEDEALIRSIFQKRKRLPDEDEDSDDVQNKLEASDEIPIKTQNAEKSSINSSVRFVVVKRSAVKKSTGLQSLCQYHSDDE
ncbi:hypothetical protein EZV62_013247 [Acer yangbiense]|uniref:Uncharacterized protein n=1 Tax=Acer yangbiense TaxID=1000413 RepID=A0A5C7HYJ4_9ROSI|nr:hypothetical protein EZV62_013247 [Acer yangbiense]